MLAEVHE